MAGNEDKSVQTYFEDLEKKIETMSEEELTEYFANMGIDIEKEEC